VVETLSHRHIGVVDEEFAVSSDAMEMFGVTSDSGWHARSDCEYSSATTFAFRGDYTPALAKHSKRFSLEDALSIGVGRMQRNFDPMRQQVERWRAQQLSAEAAKLTIYGAFIEGDLEVPKHLARRVHELSFNPQHEEFEPRTTWSGIGSSSLNAEVNAFDRLHIVRGSNSSCCGLKYRSCTLRARCFGTSRSPSMNAR